MHRVVCSHPQQNAWIARDRDKSDRIDAYKLADLLRLNRFKEVRYPQSPLRRDFKAVVQHYDELTAQQARLKTKIKARLRMQGVITRGQLGFSVRGRKAVLQAVKSVVVGTAIQQLYGMLDQSLESQAEARLLMLRAAQALPEISIRRTAPGMGPLGACRFQRLRPGAAALQLHPQALEVLSAERQSSPQQRQASAPAAHRP